LDGKGSPGGYGKAIHGILHHSIKHPDAKDTVEGVLKWWIPKTFGERGTEEVQKALDILTSRGWLTVRNVSPSQKIYGVNKKFMKDIRIFLIESEGNKVD
jgi:hypothetical protein